MTAVQDCDHLVLTNMLQLIAHLVGDYIFQSHWMAVNKSRRTWPCLLHCVTYTLAFLVLTQDALALTLIGGTHFLIDRWGLARYLIWAKNWLSPDGYPCWEWCRLTGYFDPEKAKGDSTSELELAALNNDPDAVRPIWLRVWLLIITDNTLHLVCNYVILRFIAGFPA